MTPALSIVIPHYNHSHLLPVTLDSIVRQTFRDFEVIVVDDCSDQQLKPDSIIEEYKEKGLNIKLVKNTTRQYTLHSRLNGVRAASGEVIYCMDSDDLLWGDNALESNVNILLDQGADLLQFNILSSDIIRKKAFILSTWAECERRVYLDKFVGKGDKVLGIPEPPLTLSHLEGPDIFKNFVASQEYRGVLWNKLCPKRIWEKIMPAAGKSKNIRRWEDYYLNALLLLHVKKFIGSSRLGYQHIYADGSLTYQALSFAMWDIYHILQDVCPLLSENMDSGDVKQFIKILNGALVNSANIVCKNTDIAQAMQTDDIVSRIFGESADAPSVAKMLLYIANLYANSPQPVSANNAQSAHLAALLDAERQRCQALKSSLSWRITAPLRAMADLFIKK